MGIEIERKFLVVSDAWRGQGRTTSICQAYICAEPGRTVRVRIDGDEAFLTIKSANVGLVRGEWEYPIPVHEARELLDQVCLPNRIEKARTRITTASGVWEVDEFFGANAGLVVAEIELASAQQSFDKPSWLGAEVSTDTRYANSNLMRHPYSSWQHHG